MMRRFSSVLADCVDAMSHGATIEQCLALYPRHAERLRPLLGLSVTVSQAPAMTPRADAQERAWQSVRSRADELRTGRRRAATIPVREPSASLPLLKPIMAVLAVLFLFSATSGALAYASQDALPDSPLYRIKLASEDARLWIVFDEGDRADMLLDQSKERMDEILTMVRRGDDVPENALADMHQRNERATGLMLGSPRDTELRARVLTQAQRQEELLVALWPEVTRESTPEYAEAVAHLHNTRLDGGTGAAFVSVTPDEISGGIIDISGQAEQIAEGVWSVGGVEVRIDERTIGRQDLENGESARFVVARGGSGRLHVLSLASLSTGPSPTGAVVSGAVEEVSSEGITVAGQFIPFSSNTLRTVAPRVGDRVRITLEATADGIVAGAVQPVVATDPDARSLVFVGTIEGDVSKSVSQWTVSGLPFQITQSTMFDARGGNAADGKRVEVEALNNNGQLEALRVTVLASEEPSTNVLLVGTFGGYDEEAGIWRISGLSIVPPTKPDDPPEGSMVAVRTTRDGGDLVAQDWTLIESPDDPAFVRAQGTIQQINGSRWTLEFGQVRVDSRVEVTGEPQVGARALLWGERGDDGGLQARYVIVFDDTPVLAPTPSAATPAPSPTPAP